MIIYSQQYPRIYWGIPDLGAQYFPEWIISLGGIPLIALAVAHAMVSRAKISKILGAIVSYIKS